MEGVVGGCLSPPTYLHWNHSNARVLARVCFQRAFDTPTYFWKCNVYYLPLTVFDIRAYYFKQLFDFIVLWCEKFQLGQLFQYGFDLLFSLVFWPFVKHGWFASISVYFYTFNTFNIFIFYLNILIVVVYSYSCSMPIQYVVFSIIGFIFGITIIARCYLICCLKSSGSGSD